MRKLTILFILLTICILVVATGVSKSTTDTANTIASTAQQQPASTTDDPPGTIDGAKSPELIPDDVAYSLFFRFLSDRQSEKEKRSMRAYFKKSVLDGVNVDALLAVGDEFKQRVDVVDSQAQAYRDQHPMQPNDLAMAGFQEQHRRITAELIASLTDRIGADSVEKVRRHINERVKPHVKMVPGPMMPGTQHDMGQP